jgi:hypothetical protein
MAQDHQRWHWRWLLAFMACAVAARAPVAAPYSADAIKAAYLYRFAGYVEWPALAGPDSAAPFTFAVLNADGVAEQLERLLPALRIQGRPARVRKIAAIAQRGDAQVLFVGLDDVSRIKRVVAAVGSDPVLVVTDHAEGLEAGGAINFVPFDSRLRFEVSLAAAARNGLKVSSELLSVAMRVRTARANKLRGRCCTVRAMVAER